jgi:acyl-CoA reductase-like NAD-dependent aldehyde dehydrogenase
MKSTDLSIKQKQAGLPPGVLNIVPGLGHVAGKALASHPLVRKVDVTGGTATGREIAAAAGRNLASVVAELGGKGAFALELINIPTRIDSKYTHIHNTAPMLVFEDADIDQAVDTCAFAAFVAAGQTCVSGARLLVHRIIFDEVKAKFVAKARAIRLGDPMDLDTLIMGPLISQQQLERVHAFVQGAREEGAAVLCGGGPPSPDSLPPGLRDGFLYQPTVLGDVTPAMRVWREEVFGPVVCLVPFADEAEAVRLANDSAYGLGAAIHTGDVKRAHRVADRIQAGIVWVNDHHRNSPSSPWGGVMAGSGLGRENGLEAFHEYTQSKSVVVGFGEERFDWFVPGKAAGGVRYS